MEYGGQHIPSLNDNMSINFRTADNNNESLEYNQNLFSKSNNISITEALTINDRNDNENDITNDNDILEYKICNEKGTAYIYLKTNLTERSIKLLIDTGACISILAVDMVIKPVEIINYTIHSTYLLLLAKRLQ